MSPFGYDSLSRRLMVTRLLRSGASVKERIGGQTPVHVACSFNSTDLLAIALTESNDLCQLVHSKDWHGNTPLHRACFIGVSALVEILLSAGSDVNAQNEAGDTPLHLAHLFNSRWSMATISPTHEELLKFMKTRNEEDGQRIIQLLLQKVQIKA